VFAGQEGEGGCGLVQGKGAGDRDDELASGGHVDQAGAVRVAEGGGIRPRSADHLEALLAGAASGGDRDQARAVDQGERDVDRLIGADAVVGGVESLRRELPETLLETRCRR
jgi:hypothetical protein